MLRLVAAVLAAALIGDGHANAWADQPGLSAPGSSQFKFLRGSTWYVPPQTLPAARLMLDSGLVEGVIDQTVWQITDYRAGYFWGYSTTVLKRMATGEQIGSTSCSTLLGSVTPAGHVHIAFVPQGDLTASKSTIGTGYFYNPAPQGWTFEMQMSTGRHVRAGALVVHVPMHGRTAVRGETAGNDHVALAIRVAVQFQRAAPVALKPPARTGIAPR